MNIKKVASIELFERCDQAVAPLLKIYQELLKEECPDALDNCAPWAILREAISDLTYERTSCTHVGDYKRTIKTLAGDFLSREMNFKLQPICASLIPNFLQSCGFGYTEIGEQYEEGLITASEMMMKVVDLLSSKE